MTSDRNSIMQKNCLIWVMAFLFLVGGFILGLDLGDKMVNDIEENYCINMDEVRFIYELGAENCDLEMWGADSTRIIKIWE